MFPRYVSATDFGHIWEHLKTFALLATGAGKYIAFVLPELVSVKAYEFNGKLEGINDKIGAMQRLYDFS
jgi:hypothetical protein